MTHKERPADGSTQWSTRTFAAQVGIGKDAVAKIWADHNRKPWKLDTFKVSNDPRFEEKLVDVVGLLPGSAGNERRWSALTKRPSAKHRPHPPSLPMKPGRAETVTHDYRRNGSHRVWCADDRIVADR